MIILTETTDNLQVALSGAVTLNELNCASSWRDITSATYAAGRTVCNTSGATDVNIVPSPAASTQRVVDFISIFNADTDNASVTIKIDANGTEFILFKTILGVGERVEYIDGQGFRVFSNSGALKNSINQGSNSISSGMNISLLGQNVVNNNAVANSIADVTGLSFPVANGSTYWFKFLIRYSSAATTTGSRWSINGPSFSALNYQSIYTLAATTITTNNATAYDIPAASNATSLTVGNIAMIEGIITVTADGSVIARFASEVANSAITALAGSLVYYRDISLVV